MDKEYIMSFSSFYKAAYARDVLEEQGVNSTLRKLPQEVAYSCSTGLYLRRDSMEQVRQILDERQIVTHGIYQIQREANGRKKYIRI